MANLNRYNITDNQKLSKIAISGTANVGKSTLILDMLDHWPQLSKPEKSYRDHIVENKMEINKKSSKETQRSILNFMVDQLMADYGQKKMVFDRCPLDNLIYTMWLFEKQVSDIDESFVQETIALFRQSVKFLDAIFFIPITKHNKIPIVDDKLRETDPIYIQEIDALFKAVIDTQIQRTGQFFPLEDCPPVIEVFGTREERISILEMYINDECNFFTEDDNLINQIIIP